MKREKDKIRIGVVGVGYLGKFHAEKYSRMADVELVGVADTDRSRAEEIGGRMGVPVFTSHRELIGKVDAVSVAVPTPNHFEVSRDFLLNDADVLIEKPITTTLKEADELIEIADSRGNIIQVGQLERFNPAVMALKGVIDRPMFIESHRLAIFKNRCTDVSVVLDLMIHDIDIILNFVKAEVSHIHAAGIPAVSDHVDIANARLQFATGCVANVTASRISMKNERKIRLFQKDTYISVDFASREITIVRKTDNGDCGGLIPGMNIEQLCFTQGDALEEELKSFVQSVKRREPSAVTGAMGRDALRIALIVMEQIQEANRRFLSQ